MLYARSDRFWTSVLIRRIYLGTQGLIFVVDSKDRARIDEARTELARIIQDREMKDALLLVFANKQDVPGGMLLCLTACPVSAR